MTTRTKFAQKTLARSQETSEVRETSTGGCEEWYSRTRRTWQSREDRHSRWNSRTTPTMAMNGLLQARLSLLKWLPLLLLEQQSFFPVNMLCFSDYYHLMLCRYKTRI